MLWFSWRWWWQPANLTMPKINENETIRSLCCWIYVMDDGWLNGWLAGWTDGQWPILSLQLSHLYFGHQIIYLSSVALALPLPSPSSSLSLVSRFIVFDFVCFASERTSAFDDHLDKHNCIVILIVWQRYLFRIQIMTHRKQTLIFQHQMLLKPNIPLHAWKIPNTLHLPRTLAPSVMPSYSYWKVIIRMVLSCCDKWNSFPKK